MEYVQLLYSALDNGETHGTQLFNASSLLEAHKSTSMNRYIIIFTTLTIFYLPLGFITVR
jgi:Mg2+ and Co2+ transporter CorA